MFGRQVRFSSLLRADRVPARYHRGGWQAVSRRWRRLLQPHFRPRLDRPGSELQHCGLADRVRDLRQARQLPGSPPRRSLAAAARGREEDRRLARRAHVHVQAADGVPVLAAVLRESHGRRVQAGARQVRDPALRKPRRAVLPGHRLDHLRRRQDAHDPPGASVREAFSRGWRCRSPARFHPKRRALLRLCRCPRPARTTSPATRRVPDHAHPQPELRRPSARQSRSDPDPDERRPATDARADRDGDRRLRDDRTGAPDAYAQVAHDFPAQFFVNPYAEHALRSAEHEQAALLHGAARQAVNLAIDRTALMALAARLQARQTTSTSRRRCRAISTRASTR